MSAILYVFLGGGLGSIFRYLISIYCIKIWGLQFPFGTLIVNAVGSFFIGLIWGMMDLSEWKTETKLFLIAGFLGGFTTFSTFSVETMYLFKSAQYKLAVLNILANNVVGLLLVFAGYFLGRWISSPLSTN